MVIGSVALFDTLTIPQLSDAVGAVNDVTVHCAVTFGRVTRSGTGGVLSVADTVMVTLYPTIHSGSPPPVSPALNVQIPNGLVPLNELRLPLFGPKVPETGVVPPTTVEPWLNVVLTEDIVALPVYVPG